MEHVREIYSYTPSRSVSAGVSAWMIQRITSIVLFVAVPLKIFSGYAAVGKVSSSALAALHSNRWLDAVIMCAIIFHSLYGLRVILIEYGMATKATSLFVVFSIVGVVLFLGSLWLIW